MGRRIKRTTRESLISYYSMVVTTGVDTWNMKSLLTFTVPSLQLHQNASDAVQFRTSFVGSLVGENVVVTHACLMNME